MRTISFNDVSYSRTVLKNNILKMYDISDYDDKTDWYGYANGYASGIADHAPMKLTHSQAIGVIAALSPRMNWKLNKRAALDMVMLGDCKAMGVFKDKAQRIIDLDEPSDEAILAILNGSKIQSFYMNIKYPYDANNVTIDRHALSVALGFWVDEKTHSQLTPSKYQFVVEAYILAAVKMGISPVLMQSTVWSKFRKIKQEYKK